MKKKTKMRYGKYQATQKIFILRKFRRHIGGLNITPTNNATETSKVIANKTAKVMKVIGKPLTSRPSLFPRRRLSTD